MLAAIVTGSHFCFAASDLLYSRGKRGGAARIPPKLRKIKTDEGHSRARARIVRRALFAPGYRGCVSQRTLCSRFEGQKRRYAGKSVRECFTIICKVLRIRASTHQHTDTRKLSRRLSGNFRRLTRDDLPGRYATASGIIG